MRTPVALLFVALLTACSDSEGTKRALEAQGFDKIEVTGYRFFGCSGNQDVYHTGFEACRGAKCITGVVCSGLLKGGTIRYD